MKPKFTDLARYPHPYRDSKHTDVAATFRRLRADQAKIKDEQQIKVQPLKRGSK